MKPKKLKICKVCNKTSKGETNEIVYVDHLPTLKHEWSYLKKACPTCSELLKEGVNISCDGCDSITISTPEFFASKGRTDCTAGTFLGVKSCPKCDEEKHEFSGMYVIQYGK